MDAGWKVQLRCKVVGTSARLAAQPFAHCVGNLDGCAVRLTPLY